MPKLLIAATVPKMLEAFLLPYAQHYRQRGWRVDCAASGASTSTKCKSAFDRAWDIHWSRNPLDVHAALCSAKAVHELWRKEEYDLVHVHSPVASFVTRLALRREQSAGAVRLIYTAHGFHFHENGNRLTNFAFRKLEELAGRWTNCLIVINRDDKTAAHQLRGLTPQAIRYMPGIGIDLHACDPDRTETTSVIRDWLARGIGCHDFVFVVVAEFIARKRHSDVVRAFTRLPITAHLVFAGNGPLMEATRTLVSQLGIDHRVHFLGQRSDIPAIIRASNALVLVSEHEGLPRSIMEAFAMEKPVIGSDIRGNRDLLEDGRGFLVPVGDIQKIAEAMWNVMEHPEHTAAVIQRSRRYVAHLRIENLLAQHDELYSELLCTSFTGTSAFVPCRKAASHL